VRSLGIARCKAKNLRFYRHAAITLSDMKALREKLEHWGKVAWVPILFVASLGLLVSFCNYRLQVSGIRPYLEFNGGGVGTGTLRLNWQNAGKTNAWHARARLFNFSEGGKRGVDPLDEAEIKGAGGKIFADYGGQADFRLSEAPKRFLACVRYDDDDGNHYEQVFLLSVQRDGSLIEETPPNEKTCH
jgi:hypothetical protein